MPTRTPALVLEPSIGGPAWPGLPHSRRSMPDAVQPPAAGPGVAPAEFQLSPLGRATLPSHGPVRPDYPGLCRLPRSWRRPASSPPGNSRRQMRSCTSRRRHSCQATCGGQDAWSARAFWPPLPVRVARLGHCQGSGWFPQRRAMPQTWPRNPPAAQAPAAAQARVTVPAQGTGARGAEACWLLVRARRRQGSRRPSQRAMPQTRLRNPPAVQAPAATVVRAAAPAARVQAAGGQVGG